VAVEVAVAVASRRTVSGVWCDSLFV